MRTIKTCTIFIAIATLFVAFIAGELAYNRAIFDNKVEIYEQDRIEQTRQIVNVIKQVVKILKDSAHTFEQYENIIETVKQELETTEEELYRYISNDIIDVDRVKEANVEVHNLTEQTKGSGTHIKIDGKSYIFTVAHMINEEDDYLSAIFDDDNNEYTMYLIAFDTESDLALFRIFNANDKSFLEFSDVAPEEGSRLTVIGNPSNLSNIITDGVLSVIGDGLYLFTNKIYFGNSGGAVLYKGKIVSAVSFITTRNNFPIVYSLGGCASFDKVLEFINITKELYL